ncbi:MAG TPA: right-handed parallel beta-helix repeat-containing protein [Phycisphaerae bacterium]|nr:right-handed parallel beta-helix repeat-containing protein [Phycisphaerae bacterium]
MRCLSALACSFAALLLAVGAASADTLKVGPNQKYAKPSEAFKAAKDGDLVEIDSAGAYDGDVATITANSLTIRGVGPQRVKLPANGRDAGGKAIWVIRGNDATVENIEFSGARVPDRNGAGIRPEGQNLTVRNCRFYDCENGILGGAGEILIEHCAFEHCGPVPDPATHSLYIGQACTKLVFRYNYSTDVIQGHLLKTRAKESWILYNRLTDENGTGSAVADFPNGGLVVVVGNIMHKGPRAQNTRVIAYGMEGIKHQRNALYVVNNTLVYQNHRTTSCFVRVEKTPEGFRPVILNNVCVGPIPLSNSDHIEAAGNLLLRSVAEAGFVDPDGFDYRLKAGSPCIDKAAPLGKVDGLDLMPKFQYVHPAQAEPRPVVGLLDVGAMEYAPPGTLAPGPNGANAPGLGLGTGR